MLRIDSNIIWVIVNLIIFYFLIRKFLFKRILNMIEQRKELIDGQFSEAADRQREADALKEQYEASLQQAKEESRQIVEQAKIRGEAEYEQIVFEAQKQSQKMIEKTNENLARQQEKAMDDIQSQIGELAMAAAQKLLGEQMTPESDQALYDQFLEKAGEKDDTES